MLLANTLHDNIESHDFEVIHIFEIDSIIQWITSDDRLVIGAMRDSFDKTSQGELDRYTRYCNIGKHRQRRRKSERKIKHSQSKFIIQNLNSKI